MIIAESSKDVNPGISKNDALILLKSIFNKTGRWKIYWYSRVSGFASAKK